MTHIAHFVRPLIVLVAFTSCASGEVESAPASTEANFGVRAVDPWADDEDTTEPAATGRQVYVPEPVAAPEEDPENGNNSGGQTSDPPTPPAQDPPADEDEDPAQDPPNEDTEDPADPPPPAPDPPEPAPTGIQGNFSFSDQASLLYVQVFKDPNTLGARFAHNHAIRSTGWRGSLERIGNGTDCSVTLELPVSGLVVDEPAMRRRVGYDDEISDNQRQEIRGHMTAENQLNIDQYPTMSFRGTRCLNAGAERGTMTVEGTMTIRGASQPVRINLQYREIDDVLYLRGELAINHTDYGFRPYSAFGGSVRNQEGMTLGFDFQSISTN
jgi:hypothetical protein